MPLKTGRYHVNRVPETENERKLRLASQLVPSPSSSKPFETRYTMNKDSAVLNAPYYGPFIVTKSRTYPPPYATARDYYVKTDWWRSKAKVGRLPLYVQREIYWTELKYGAYRDDAPNTLAKTFSNNGIPNGDALASNTARSRFVDAVRDKNTAALAVTIAEWEQSNKMIALRAGQLFNAMKKLKRGDISGVRSLPQIRQDFKDAKKGAEYQRVMKRLRKEPRNFRAGSVDVSNKWLEYHFGWVPLIQDIYQATQVLTSNPPSHKVSGSGKYLEPVQVGNFVPNNHTNRGLYECRVKVGAEVYVSNPNLALANQLGLVNPATVAWEVVPFSFVVDWFFTVGKTLDSFSDLLGYSIRNPYTTTVRKCKDWQHWFNEAGNPVPGSLSINHAIWLRRVMSIPTYKFTALPFKGFSPARGATAIALLCQQFLNVKK